MTDKFISAIMEVGDYVAGGMELDAAVAEVAAKHGLPVHALKNRAERRIGDIEAFRASRASDAVRDRISAQRRRDFWNQSVDGEMVKYMHERRTSERQ